MATSADGGVEYFVQLKFMFENTSGDWIFLDDFEILGLSPQVTENLEVVVGPRYTAWYEAHKLVVERQQKVMSVVGVLAGGVLSANVNDYNSQNLGLAVSSASTYSLVQLYSDKKGKLRKNLPKGHLLKGKVLVPPGMSLGRWIFLGSKNHEQTGFINDLQVKFKYKDPKVEKQSSMFIHLRENSQDYNWQKKIPMKARLTEK